MHCVGLFNSRDVAIRQLVRQEFADLIKTRYQQRLANTDDLPALFLQYLHGDLEQLKLSNYRDYFHPLAQLPTIVKTIGVQLSYDQVQKEITLEENSITEPIRTGPKPFSEALNTTPTTETALPRQNTATLGITQQPRHWSQSPLQPVLQPLDALGRTSPKAIQVRHTSKTQPSSNKQQPFQMEEDDHRSLQAL